MTNHPMLWFYPILTCVHLAQNYFNSNLSDSNKAKFTAHSETKCVKENPFHYKKITNKSDSQSMHVYIVAADDDGDNFCTIV